MSNSTVRYPEGTVLTVYGRMGTQKEMCDLGCKHDVYYYSVKRIHVALVKTGVFIKALHYVRDGYGNEYHAFDAQGRMYWTRDSWDGPLGWQRGDRKVFFTRPTMGEVKKDMNGRIL